MANLRQTLGTLIFVAALTLPGTPYAFWDGYKLKEWSDAADRVARGTPNSTDHMLNGVLTGYVAGASEMLNGVIICLPSGASIAQTLAIVQNYVRANPEKWNLPAGEFVRGALMPVFPCR